MKFLVLIVFIKSILLGVNINIVEDNNTVNSLEIEVLQSIYMKKHIKINDENSKKIIFENRLLSNEFLNQYGFDEQKLIRLRIELEKKVSNELILKNENLNDLNDSILKSYYLDHLKDFEKPEIVEASFYKFENYLDAVKFYEKKHLDLDYNNEDINMTRVDNNISLEMTQVQLRYMIRHTSEILPYVLTPQFYFDHYTVVLIRDIHSAGIYDFEMVKKNIIKSIHEKSLINTREKLLEKLRP